MGKIFGMESGLGLRAKSPLSHCQNDRRCRFGLGGGFGATTFGGGGKTIFLTSTGGLGGSGGGETGLGKSFGMETGLGLRANNPLTHCQNDRRCRFGLGKSSNGADFGAGSLMTTFTSGGKSFGGVGGMVGTGLGKSFGMETGFGLRANNPEIHCPNVRRWCLGRCGNPGIVRGPTARTSRLTISDSRAASAASSGRTDVFGNGGGAGIFTGGAVTTLAAGADLPNRCGRTKRKSSGRDGNGMRGGGGSVDSGGGGSGRFGGWGRPTPEPPCGRSAEADLAGLVRVISTTLGVLLKRLRSASSRPRSSLGRRLMSTIDGAY